MEEEIEAAATRPPMLLGLPRKLSSLLLCIATLCWILIAGWIHLAVSWVAIGIIWAGIKPLVAMDYWGFDILLTWLRTSARAMDVREWGGVRAASFPLRLRSYGMVPDAE